MSRMWLSRTLLHLIVSELADASGKSDPTPRDTAIAPRLLRPGVQV